jgi:hypothetical protein
MVCVLTISQQYKSCVHMGIQILQISNLLKRDSRLRLLREVNLVVDGADYQMSLKL